MKLLCDIYKSLNRSDYYLYVKSDEKFARVPEPLLHHMGKLSLVMTIPLTAEQTLANAKAEVVIKAVSQNGYYLQVPPQKEAYMQDLSMRNERL
jgi:uncharacterized protein